MRRTKKEARIRGATHASQTATPIRVGHASGRHGSARHGNGQVHDTGIYDTVTASDFPLAHRSIVVYVMLTEGHGETPILLRLVDVDEERPPIFEVEGTVDFDDPISVEEIVLREGPVVFPEPDECRLQLFASGQPLLERRLYVLLEGEADET